MSLRSDAGADPAKSQETFAKYQKQTLHVAQVEGLRVLRM
jgi:hypothetical protein